MAKVPAVIAVYKGHRIASTKITLFTKTFWIQFSILPWVSWTFWTSLSVGVVKCHTEVHVVYANCTRLTYILGNFLKTFNQIGQPGSLIYKAMLTIHDQYILSMCRLFLSLRVFQ